MQNVLERKDIYFGIVVLDKPLMSRISSMSRMSSMSFVYTFLFCLFSIYLVFILPFAIKEFICLQGCKLDKTVKEMTVHLGTSQQIFVLIFFLSIGAEGTERKIHI